MKLIVNADDFGLSQSVNQNILRCFDEGALNSVSLMANGYAFDSAVTEIKKRDRLRLSIHLNLIEGKPISSPQVVSHLVGDNGLFDKDFIGLSKYYLRLNARLKEEMRQQIYSELKAQIEKVQAVIDRPLSLDSHQHTHLLPFVADPLVDLLPQFDLSYVRIPFEPKYSLGPVQDFKSIFSTNFLKWKLLAYLSKKLRSKIERVCYESAVQCPKLTDHFFGVRFTGKFEFLALQSALDSIGRSNHSRQQIVEVLLHPGQAGAGEDAYWNHYPEWKSYYYSDNRKAEGDLLRDPKIIELFKSLETDR